MSSIFKKFIKQAAKYSGIIWEGVSLKWWIRKYGQELIAFDLPSLGEWQFIGPVLLLYAKRNPTKPILIVHHRDTINEFCKLTISLKNPVYNIRRRILNLFSFKQIALFLTSEQYDLGLSGVYSISMFHGQAAKGLSFVPDVITTFDGLFLNGPMHLEAFNLFIDDFLGGQAPKNLDLYPVGYPKSDAVINGQLSNPNMVDVLRLDTQKPTVLYAPAFNEGASLREFGLDIIETLSRSKSYNVIVKLPIDCWEPTSNIYATGGVDWFSKIGELEQYYDNLRFYREFEIDPLLACADVLVTCISSVSFEFFALNKPVVFIETPKYYSQYLQKRMPEHDVNSWATRTTVNGGKEFGLVVNTLSELPSAIDTVLRNPREYPKQQERLKTYLLYNPGKAAERAVSLLEELLEKRPVSQREVVVPGMFGSLYKNAKGKLRPATAKVLEQLLNAQGYTLVKSGLGYIDAKATVEGARRKGLSVCDYLESMESDPRKIGRRNLIIKTMESYGVFRGIECVCEIGVGTGQYLEKTIDHAKPSIYEVYETDRGWVKFLCSEYGSVPGMNLKCHPADGRSLTLTKSGSIDLVQAHGVFVYLPLLQIVEYLKECVRVCRKGGFIVFDCYLDQTFNSLQCIEAWLKTQYRFPVIVPHQLLKEFAGANAMQLIHQFEVIHGAGTSVYFIYKKSIGE